MSTFYTLCVKHHGTESGDFCIYQTNDQQAEDIRSLVWYSKRAHPQTALTFSWREDYGFAWSGQGILTPGTVFEASQLMETSHNDVSLNSIDFSCQNSAFLFKPTKDPATIGRLVITCDETIPAKATSVGIAMSDRPAFACAASPKKKYTFHQHPRYWIAFGRFEEGEVIDLNRVCRKLEIVYRENQFDKSIRLSETNTWIEESKK